MKLYEYWDGMWRPGRPSPYIRVCVSQKIRSWLLAFTNEILANASLTCAFACLRAYVWDGFWSQSNAGGYSHCIAYFRIIFLMFLKWWSSSGCRPSSVDKIRVRLTIGNPTVVIMALTGQIVNAVPVKANYIYQYKFVGSGCYIDSQKSHRELTSDWKPSPLFELPAGQKSTRAKWTFYPITLNFYKGGLVQRPGSINNCSLLLGHRVATYKVTNSAESIVVVDF